MTSRQPATTMDDPQQEARAKLILSELKRRRNLLAQARGKTLAQNVPLVGLAILLTLTALAPNLSAWLPGILVGSFTLIVGYVHSTNKRIDAILDLLEIEEATLKSTLNFEQMDRAQTVDPPTSDLSASPSSTGNPRPPLTADPALH